MNYYQNKNQNNLLINNYKYNSKFINQFNTNYCINIKRY